MANPEISFRLESRHLQSRLLALAFIICGLILVGLADQGGSNQTESARYLGALLIAGGTLAVFWLDRVILEVFSGEKCLLLTKQGIFEGPRKQKIPRSQIQEIRVEQIGSKWKGLETYHLILRTTGQRINTGYWNKQRSDVEAVANQLRFALELDSEQAMDSSLDLELSEVESPRQKLRLPISFAAGVITYVIWYRFSVGPWCPAMWGGTAPPYIIGLVTVFVFQLQRRRKS